MDQVLEDFVVALRNAGVRISLSESIDAARTLKIMGYRDREALKTSLAAVLAKTVPEKEIFTDCFDLFFSIDNLPEGQLELTYVSETDELSELSPLSRMLMLGDRPGLMAAMMEGSQAVELSEMRYFTQKNSFSRKILSYMGMENVNRDIDRLYQEGESSELSHALKGARNALIDHVKYFVDRHYNLFTEAERNQTVEGYLKNVKLSAIEEKNFHQMHAIIRKMVKRLNDTHSRRKKSFRRGQLDFRRTLRKNLPYQGPLFEILWKKRKIDRPNVVVICDVSRSVRPIVRFCLLFLYSLNETIIKIRSFIFCNNLIDVSHIFDEYLVEEAVERLKTGEGLDIGLSRTDYGQAFRDFRDNFMDLITHKTTVIILGDGRNNFYEPESDILRRMQEKSKRLLWLNPEIPSFWSTGDSEMHLYGPLCDLVRECNTLSHLERIIEDIL